MSRFDNIQSSLYKSSAGRPKRKSISSSIDLMESWIGSKVDEHKFQEAVVTSKTDGRIVLLRDTDDTISDDEEYYQVGGFEPQVGDAVICFRINGELVVLGKKQVADPSYKYLSNYLRFQNGKGLLFDGAEPVITPAAAAGTGAIVSGIIGSDMAGRFALTSGSASLAAGIVANVVFSAALPTDEYIVILQPADSDSANEIAYVNYPDRLTTGYPIRLVSAMVASTSHIWFYRVDIYA